MTQFYTYIHCKPDGSIFYVGKGHGTRSHSFKQRNKHHKNTVAKYGASHIGVFVFPCESEDQAFADEIQQIAQLRTEGYELVNQTDGGEGPKGRKRSAATQLKLDAAGAGRGNKIWLGKTHTPETKAKMAKYATGKTKSEQARAKISAANKGHVQPEHEKRKQILAQTGSRASEQARINMSAAQKGHSVSDETKRKISAARTGKKPAPFSAERRKNMSAAAKARWVKTKNGQH